MNNKILNEANKLIKEDGLYNTFINDIKLYKTQSFCPRGPLIYDVCLVLVLQGTKIGYLKNNTFTYNNKKYLVVPTTLPFECETIASKQEPYICMLISINKELMYEIIDLIGNQKKNKKYELAVFSDDVTLEIEDITYRLLKTLQNKQDSEILGTNLLKELFYRVAKSKNACFLYNMFLNDKNEAKIARSIRYIHKNYNEKLDLNNLAKKVDMSISSYHNYFKKSTSYTPLQYIKNIRLNKAKELLLKNYQVNDCAYEIGYESVSQFSRDFKSYFGKPPKEIKSL
ncbi:AraC family transcriptional regulator [Malaciobacter mytili]|uniref:AraC family transcriptional regulator n=1 Tax=Malaciobacter mytili LMG 24559 TaxID=1032238 RepID=A0AAX2ADT0_9BACT|nr:AraC family transcriptional regulator [Malaciobacter mytili]AXH15503.1 transcriptional regulator, AraC family [Malaciobacter mytili LMG 24559]RXI47067.1 AraC family transcriptional regulator [Malaciobacter mytili]RXK15187.1 AraC family transcriptional regulator [Malaciobacter mytili LMG 24559]